MIDEYKCHLQSGDGAHVFLLVQCATLYRHTDGRIRYICRDTSVRLRAMLIY